MAGPERKRSLSESSEEEEAVETSKVTRLHQANSPGLAGRSDLSESSSDSDSESNSNSSSSSGEENSQNRKPKISLHLNPPNQDPSHPHESLTDSHQDSVEGAVAQAEDSDTDGNILAQKLEAEQARKRQGSGLSLEGGGGEYSLGSIDEIKSFLTVSAEGACSGPVDPVFVNHEDSQHATNMDSIVFEGEGIQIQDDMNEPRLDSVIHSSEGSLVLGNDAEEGELPSSPEASGQVAFAGDTPVSHAATEKGERKFTAMSDDECRDQDQLKKNKRLKKKKVKKSKQSDDEDAKGVEETRPKRQKHKKFKSESSEQSGAPPVPPSPSLVAPPPPPATVPVALASTAPVPVALVPAAPAPALVPTAPPPTTTVPAAAPTALPSVESQAFPAGCPHAQTKARKTLSLKDYKAKKEAEKQRRSQEGSGSESNSCPNSASASKEPSPSPEPSKQKDLPVASVDTSKEAVDTEPDTEGQMEMEPISDNEMELGTNVDEEAGTNDNLSLQDFDILDQLEESENDTSKESGDESDSMEEDELHKMIEQDVPATVDEHAVDIEPQEKLTKLVLEERGGNLFEVLPLGWVAVTHNSGIPLYLHRDTRVVTASRPYDLGNGSVRKHNLPVSAIPCFSYRYSTSLPAPAAATSPSPAPPPASDSSIIAGPAACPYSAAPAGSSLFARENVSPDSTTDGTAVPPAAAEPSAEISNIFPKAQIETIEESMKKSELTPEEVTNYCKKIFVFKELEVAKFKTWKERRAYYKQSQKKKIDNILTNRPTLPEGTKIITIPALEMSTIPGTEGDSAINQRVVKKSKKKWLMNPVGKSMVCLLHEYVQQSLKMQPYYTFTELDNAATPYAAIVHINKIEYGHGTGSSKKIAKSEAAKRTLEMLIPEIKDKLEMGGEDVGDGPDLSFFDDIRVEDPRVAELCNRTSEPAPYQILVTCLQRNYGLGDTHIHQELKAVRNGKNEYTMRVDKREVAVICKNKKDGKQLAAAKLLQQLHPHIGNWGSLLRMYGNRSIRTLKKKKEKETEVTGLQSRSSQSTMAPSMAILEKLKEEMRNLRDIKKSITPIGKFVLPAGSSQTGINTDHVDF